MIVFLSLPYLTHVIGQRFSFSKECQNILVVKILLFFLVVGGFMTAAAPRIIHLITGKCSHLKAHDMTRYILSILARPNRNLEGLIFAALAIFSVGEGIRAPLLAVAASYINTSLETGRLYTIMSITDAFSHMIGDPVIQSTWSVALGLGGRWLVLPFLVTTV